ncbi:30S ribosomal protein S6--L-glutamate ligase [Dokdonella sp.]|uniref:30S ribosomal protein S6--L-glutamate ligase n=1 Tax=Dokdonella sp. TaxID=2291710 RepID=UPI0026284A60|nr:30S ribosomal protein S6--L-glutamate ligase [Dokdonella sp.]
MKIAILSRNARLHSTVRLVEAARARGHSARVLDPLRCYMRIDAGKFEMHYKGRVLRGVDAVIPRIGSSITFYGTAVVRQFEMMGVHTPNSSDAILRARDKLRALQMLAGAGIALPTTVFGDNPDDTTDLLAMLGEPPYVIKLNEGAQGQGVLLAEKRSAARGMIEALRGLYANFLVQEFIREANGADLRCFVVDGKVVAAMRRQAPEGEFRANLHRGAKAAAVELSALEEQVAVRAARLLGLGIAGVDLLRSARGPLVLEVNSSPGLEGIEAASGVDVATKIVASLERAMRKKRKGGRSR